MDRARTLGHSVLLAAMLIAAWVPAAMIASPGARETASSVGTPEVEVVPAEAPREIAAEAALERSA